MLILSRQCAISFAVLLLAGCSLEPRAGASRSTPNGSKAPSEALAALSAQGPSAEAASAPATSAPPQSAAPAATRPAAFVAPYPRATWRLAQDDDLDRVVLWFSQILIRHAGARNEVPFVLGYWSSAPPPATRTREEALALAQQLAEQAAQDPSRFAELARRHSEDLPSRDEGGAVGGYKATVLNMWPQILDALAALQPGQSSRVVETKYGFHILYRSAPPAEAMMGGAHIVIGHENAPWLAVFAADKTPKRSREEALRVANELYRRARAEPERFSELAKEFSEHADAVAGGDFGEWSTRAFASFPPRSRRLSELAVGEVGAPIETHLGFEIVRRTALRPRKQYRAHLLIFPFDEFNDAAPNTDASERQKAFLQANAAATALARTPARFARWDAGHLVWQWEEGRELAPLTALLEPLDVGQITAKPVVTEYGFVVAQRLAPEPVEQLDWHTELPAPEQPDLARFFDYIEAANARTFLPMFATRVQQELGLTDAAAEQLRALHDVSGRLVDNTPYHVLMQVVGSVLEGTRQLLGEQGYATYRAVLNRDAADILLGAPADSPREQGF